MPLIHEKTAERWHELSLVEQMANVGSDVERAINWYQKKDMPYFEKAFDRALELLDLTISDPRWKTGRKELCRVREVFCDIFYGENQYNVTFDELKKYFLYFGIAARLKK